MLVARHLLLDRVVARLVAPRLGKGQEEALVAGQSVDHRRRRAAERAVICVIGDFEPGEIGDILAHRQIGAGEGAGRSLITRILSTVTLRLRLEARGVLLLPPIAHRAAGVYLAPLIVATVAAPVPDPRTAH